MIDLEPKEIAFLKGILGTDYSKQIFANILEKFIHDLKDIEQLDRKDKNYNQQIEFRLTVVDKLREILNRLIMLSEDIHDSKYKPI